jgi:hypothetical protein
MREGGVLDAFAQRPDRVLVMQRDHCIILLRDCGGLAGKIFTHFGLDICRNQITNGESIRSFFILTGLISMF